MNHLNLKSSAKKRNIKVALILPGVITDQSWNTVGYQGLMTAREELGVEIAYSESVQPPNDVDVFRKYANEGFQLVIGHGSEYAEGAITSAKEHPQTYFAVMNSDVIGPNLAGLDTKNEEMGYIGGYIAGLVSRSKVVGFIGATPIIAMRRAEEGFTLGAKAACPDCTVLAEYIGVFDNQEKGRETALSLIQRKVDVFFNNDDEAGLGSMKVAEEKGILTIGSDYDQKAIAPKAIITSILARVTPMILSIIREVKEDEFKPNQVRFFGFETDTYDITELDLNLISQENAQRIYAIRDLLRQGTENLPHLSTLPGSTKTAL